MTALQDLQLPPFEPHPLMKGAHPMTVVAAFLPRQLGELSQNAREELVEVDADTTVRVCLDGDLTSEAGVLVLVHGLTGSSESAYVMGTAAKAVERGLGVARLNVRGCGGTGHLTRAAYHGGLTADVAAVARHVVERHGAKRVHAAGFSIGGNMVLKWAAQLGEAPPPWLASTIAVCPAVDFDFASRSLDDGFVNRLYQRRFLRGLGDMLKGREAAAPGSIDLSGLSSVPNLRSFDERYTAPLGGFGGVESYYASASSAHELDRIRVPTAIIAAKDDPLIPFRSFEDPVFERSPWLRLVSTDRGGHVAFVGRAPAQGPGWTDSDRFWAENRVVQIAASLYW